MTTKRKQSQSISRTGIRFVVGVISDCNCIFQEISLENDIGNDGYIEFIQDEQATGCCIAVQIKSGDSYVISNGNFVLKADRDHFEYWRSHVLPVAAIIYSPGRNSAVWCDVTEYLSRDFDLIETGPYNIEIEPSREFSYGTFHEFMSHFLEYRERFKHRLGDALERFSDIKNHQNCLDGLTHLFSFQRQNIASWYYVISCFQNFRLHPLLLHLINTIAYLPGHGDIFWHRKNTIADETRDAAIAFLKKRFGRIEVLCMLETVTDGGGFARGAIGQPVDAIVSQVTDHETILDSIAFDPRINEEVRYWALLLLVCHGQWRDSGTEQCLKLIDKYQQQFADKDSEISEMISGIRQELVANGKFLLYC